MTHHVTELKTRLNDGIFYYFSVIGASFFVIFILSTMIFALFRSLTISDLLGGLYDGAVFGAFLGGILAGIVTLVDIFERFRCFKKYHKISYRSRQQRIFLIKNDCDNIFERLLAACKSCNYHIKTEDKKYGIIKATTNRSWRSFGEKIEIIIRKSTDGSLTLKVSSEPILFTTVLDYCKNFINIELLLSTLFYRE